MSAKILLQLAPGADAHAVARVIPLADDAPASSLVLSADWSSVDVAPGRYVIEASLPSGAVVREQVHLREGQVKRVALAAPARAAARDVAAEVSLWAVTAAQSWDKLAKLARARPAPAPAEVAAALGATPHDKPRRGATVAITDAPAGKRVLAMVAGDGAVEVVAVPVPWRTGNGQLAAVEIAVSPLRVSVPDPDFGSMIGYLAAGALDNARRVLEPDSPGWNALVQAIHGKVENPYAAAAGACVLIQAETSGKAQEWDPWLDNLAAWFPWLPDGAALLGARRLRTAKTAADLEVARAALVTALGRGLPVFAAAARLLLDAFGTLLGDPDFDSKGLDDGTFAALRTVMMRMQTGQPFTALRLGGTP